MYLKIKNLKSTMSFVQRDNDGVSYALTDLLNDWVLQIPGNLFQGESWQEVLGPIFQQMAHGRRDCSSIRGACGLAHSPNGCQAAVTNVCVLPCITGVSNAQEMSKETSKK